ncbi:MAG: ABC transporter ATP-binding protein [Proteobacteria bacterium]|nr:ABC transporter ATP-binding protein [Pseudomonadota bacterium]
MTKQCIELEDIWVARRGRTILDVKHLSVASSEILAVVGPNGAGKSTLVQVMGLLLRPDRGRVVIAGEVITPQREYAARKRLSCVFQSPHLLDRSVRANAELGMRLRGVPVDERKKRATRWLTALGLEELADRQAKTLSGGEAQRVNLARALALSPEVMLLDEPLGGLDAPTRHAMMDELGPLMRSGAGAGLLVTHDRRVALALGDRVAVMLRGQVRQIGPPDDVFSSPIDEEVASFIGVENLIPAEANGAEIHFESSCAMRRSEGIDGEVIVCLRAEEVRLDHTNGENDDHNVLSGKIINIRRRGIGFTFDVDVGFKLTGRISRADRTILSLEPHQEVKVRIRPEALHCIPRKA